MFVTLTSKNRFMPERQDPDHLQILDDYRSVVRRSDSLAGIHRGAWGGVPESSVTYRTDDPTMFGRMASNWMQDAVLLMTTRRSEALKWGLHPAYVSRTEDLDNYSTGSIYGLPQTETHRLWTVRDASDEPWDNVDLWAGLWDVRWPDDYKIGRV